MSLLNGTDLVRTRWYHGLGEVWRGFSKNAYGALAYRKGFSLAALAVLAPLLVVPYVRLVSELPDGQIPLIVSFQVALSLSTRAVTAWVGRDPMWTTPFHAVTVVVWAATLATSMVLAHSGKEIQWKGRSVRTTVAGQTE